MTRRIFRAICGVALVLLLASVSLLSWVLYSYFTQVQLQQLHVEASLAAQGVIHGAQAYLDDLQTDCRITWISADGAVLYDSTSTVDTMENHLEREEVKEALSTGYGESTRYSDTLMQQYLYAAICLPDGTVLRLAHGQNSVWKLLLGLVQPMLLILAVVILFALLLADRMAAWIVKPLNALNLDAPMANRDYDEIRPLLRRLDSQQKQLQIQAAELKRRQRQFEAVTRDMGEGLVLLDNKTRVLTINPAAVRILCPGETAVGRELPSLCQSAALCDILYRALNGEKIGKPVQLSGGTYQMIGSPVRSEGIISGLALLIFDMTETQKAEILRREFTANVSHELKTPLHAISGYAELMTGGLVPEQDMKGFSEKIYGEAQRMIRLVEDILRLSRLDEGGAPMTWGTVDLKEAVESAFRNLSASAELAAVTLKLEGESIRIQAIPQMVDSIVFNLVDNAIKYNRPGGHVKVTLTRTEEGARMTVEDTGIGIPQDHQDRIFERFYRVDKSRSKQVGGTGLGLSIVKHSAAILGASITVHSIPGNGTAIAVQFSD